MLATTSKFFRHALFCTLIFLYGISSALAQPFANNWIDYNQKYYKIKIVNDGVYRIGLSTLNNAGIPAAAINPQTFQIWNRGQQQFIYVQGEADGIFDATDYLEFYAEKNDGTVDTALYPTGEQGNPYYSNFSDTAVYYLTWSSSSTSNRMLIDNATNFTAFSASPFFWANSTKVYSDEYYYGEIDYYGQSKAGYHAGEGWFSSSFSKPSNLTYNIAVSNLYSSGPAAIFKTSVISASNDASSSVDNELRIQFGSQAQPLTDVTFDGYQLFQYSFNIPLSDITSNNNIVYTSVNLPSTNPGRMAVGYIDLKYPHTFDFENKSDYKFSLPFSGNAKNRVQIINFNNQSTTERLYNLTNHTRVTIGLNGSVKTGLITEFGNEQVCYLTSDAKIQTITSIKPVTQTAFFTDYSVNSTNVLTGKKFIIISTKELESSAQSYEAFRFSLQAKLVYAEELYDQFSYGVLKHPLAIRNFADLVYHKIPSAEYFLYLGKSISSELTRHDLNNYKHNLVPSFGYPSCDILLSSNIITPTSIVPAFATGRIAAKSDQDVNTYLSKLQEYEALPFTEPNAPWRKQILHFAGGSNSGQTQLLQYYLKSYEDTIEGPLFGGNVTNFEKSTTAPIQITTSNQIKVLVNQGVSIMTFFGHASGSGFDVDLDAPDNYLNTNGKYPLIIGNSCFAGDIHQPTDVNLSSSEQWTLHERGTIGFLAQVGAGFPSTLYNYTQELYANISRKSYGQPIGKCVKTTIYNLQSQAASDEILTATCQEMTLHGDPALVIASPADPDLMVSAANITIAPSSVTTDLDSFMVIVKVTNLGRAVTQNVELRLEHKDTSYTKTIIGGVNYQVTDTFYVKINPLEDAGINDFKLTVDPVDFINPEILETNNVVDFNVNIISNDVFPIYPYEYAIIPNNKVTLKASTANPFAYARNYIFQIDTTDLFNSTNPLFHQEGMINSAGGVVEWNTNNLTLFDSTTTVYFWRVAVADTTGTGIGYKWHESSFQYIPQKTGWGQSHIFQYKKDKYTFIDYNRTNRRFDFSNNAKLLTVTTYGHASTQNEWFGSEVRLDLDQIDYGGCNENYLYVVVFDSLDLAPWGNYNGTSNATHQFGNVNNYPHVCRSRVENYFSFWQDSIASMNACVNMINNQIPDGFYFVVYTFPIGLRQTASTLPVRNLLSSMGASSINSVIDGNPYIFFMRKNVNNTVHEVYGNLPTDKIQLFDTLKNDWYYGNVITTLAGPASQWNEFHWNRFALENATADSVTVQLFGVKLDGTEQLLATYQPTSLDVLNLNSVIDASVYPYAKLKLYTQDDVGHSPDQLKYWRLYYAPAPEAAVAPNLFLNYTTGSMQEGQEFNFKMAIKNVSPINMDSMLVKYWIEDEDRIVHDIAYQYHYPRPWMYQDSLHALDTMIIGIKYPTNLLGGANTFWVEINPNNDQLEQYHFNNYATLRFNVDRDKYNPLLDVTFDGIHILDGDLVSAKPDISIQLKDENHYLLLDSMRDTANFKVSLIRPNSTIQERVYFMNGGTEVLKFTPAQNTENRAKIEYKPTFLVDGKYKLIIQAVDKSNNKSGAYDFKTSFEIITKASITEVMNYPNPFSTATHFVFTLTGSEVPETFKIQIFNVSGKVVKEIHADELGPVHVGRNITDFAWDGRDDFGDRLANGVYFYKVYTRIASKEIDKMETNADQFFKKGFGKMVIIH